MTKIDRYCLFPLESSNIKLSLFYNDNSNEDIILLREEVEILDQLKGFNAVRTVYFRDLGTLINITRYGITILRTYIYNDQERESYYVIDGNKLLYFLSDMLYHTPTQDSYCIDNRFDRQFLSPKINVKLLDDKTQESLIKNIRLYDSLSIRLKSLTHIARNNSPTRDHPVTVHLSREPFEEDSFYFDIRDCKDKRIINGGVILHDNIYCIHT